MSNGNICCVGQQIISQAIYADSSLTKTEVANVFAVKRPSIWRYDKLIYYIIKDYREDYPLLPNDLQLIKKRGCKRDRTGEHPNFAKIKEVILFAINTRE